MGWLFSFLRPVMALAFASTICSAQGTSPSPVATENQLPGSVGWDSGQPGVGVIEGFADTTSVQPGGRVRVFVQSRALYRVEIYRLGWYRGAGARLHHVSGALEASQQPPCSQDEATRMISCAQWRETYSFPVPENWLSGVYWVKFAEAGPLARFTGTIFIVRERTPSATIMVQLPFNTYQAYNDWGGVSLYHGPDSRFESRSFKVSYDRPYHKGRPNFVVEGYPMIRWLEKEGFPMAYTSSIDLHERPGSITGYRAWITVGHDEYWSRAMRTNVETGRDRGIHLGFFGANEIYRQVRMEPSPLGPSRVMTCYVLSSLDPYVQAGGVDEATGASRAAPLYRPENQLVGIQYEDGFHTRPDRPSDWTAASTSHWLFQGTGLRAGDSVRDVVGHEFDALSDNGHTPANLTVVGESHVCNDYGVCTYTSHSTIYQAPGGALVFAAGSMQWPNALDRYNHPCASCAPVDPRLLRLNRNLLRRLAGLHGPTGDGVSPETGQGQEAAFTARFSHPDGAGELSEVRIRTSPPGCTVVYATASGRFSLLDSGGASTAPAAAGSNAPLANSQCSLDLARTSVSLSDMEVRIDLRLRFLGARGSKELQLQASSRDGRSSPWETFGRWNDSPGAVPIRIVSELGDSFQRFLASFSVGSRGIARLRFKVADAEEDTGCTVEYDEQGLYLIGSDGQPTGSARPGTASILESGACLLDPSQSAAIRENGQITLQASLWFPASFQGVKRLYSEVSDDGGASSGWIPGETITVRERQVSLPVSARVETDGDAATVISGIYFHPETTGNLRAAYILVNTVPTGRGGCQLTWNLRDNLISLANDDNTALSLARPDSGTPLENNQCKVVPSEIVMTTGRFSALISARITLKASVPRKVFLQTLDVSGASLGWLEKGAVP